MASGPLQCVSQDPATQERASTSVWRVVSRRRERRRTEPLSVRRIDRSCGVGARLGGMGYDDFVLRLIHASHTPQDAPKRATRSHMSGRSEPVGRGQYCNHHQHPARCTTTTRPRKATHRDRGGITSKHIVRPARRPRSLKPRLSTPPVRTGRPAAPELPSGANTTSIEG